MTKEELEEAINSALRRFYLQYPGVLPEPLGIGTGVGGGGPVPVPPRSIDVPPVLVSVPYSLRARIPENKLDELARIEIDFAIAIAGRQKTALEKVRKLFPQ